MYYATKRKTGSQRIVGLAAVVGVNALVFWIAASGFGAAMMNEITETEVAIIDVPEIEEEEPPPPPPVDVELPPPPPQVVLPEFFFEVAPSENAIQRVEAVKEPARPEVRPAPKVTIAKRPLVGGRRFEKPEYPSASIRAEEEGEVTVSACVDIQGKMSAITLVKSSGFDRLDNAVMKGLPRTRVEPAQGTDGKPIAFCDPPYVFTIVYDLEEAR